MRIISGCLSRTRSVIGEISDSTFLLQDSVDIRLSSFLCRLSSVVYHRSSITYYNRLFNSSLFRQLTPLLPCLRWPLVDGCCLMAPHLSGVAVWRPNFAAAVYDACQHPTSCSVTGTGLLVTTWCRLSPVFVTIDEGCDLSLIHI